MLFGYTTEKLDLDDFVVNWAKKGFLTIFSVLKIGSRLVSELWIMIIVS